MRKPSIKSNRDFTLVRNIGDSLHGQSHTSCFRSCVFREQKKLLHGVTSCDFIRASTLRLQQHQESFLYVATTNLTTEIKNQIKLFHRKSNKFME